MVSEILERLKGDTAFIVELVTDFLASVPSTLTTLSEAADSADFTALHFTAHSLKSAAVNLGAMSIAEVCHELERIGRLKEGIDRTPGLLSKVGEAVGKFYEVFEEVSKREGRITSTSSE